jgi:hypothetical protein
MPRDVSRTASRLLIFGSRPMRQRILALTSKIDRDLFLQVLESICLVT